MAAAKGFDKRVWTAEPSESPDGPALRLTYVSADGEEGYPGQLTAHVTPTNSKNDDKLTIAFEATTTAPTPINLRQPRLLQPDRRSEAGPFWTMC